MPLPYEYMVTEAIIRMCKVTLADNILYQFRKSVIKTFDVPLNSYSFVQDDIFAGSVPSKMVLAMISSKAFNCSPQNNPYNFQNFGAEFLAFYVGGTSLPAAPWQPDFQAGHYAREFCSLFTGTGMYGKNEGNYISRTDAGGYTMFIFDVDPWRSPDYA